MEQYFPAELQVDLVDFRMRYDKQDRHNLLNMDKSHYHKSYEIYYLISGECNYFIKDKTFHIKGGDIVLVNSNDLHKTSLINKSTRERILICLNEEFINSMANSYEDVDLFSCFKNGHSVLRLGDEYLKVVQEQIHKMYSLYTESTYKVNRLDEFYMKVMTSELLVLLNKLSNSIKNELIEDTNSLPPKIVDIVTYINNNYMSDITLDFISSQFNISKYYFVRVFKESIGLNFIDYLNIIRLREAQKLLLNTDFNISRVSTEVGYSDSNYFCRVFKLYCKCSPTQYKKQQLE